MKPNRHNLWTIELKVIEARSTFEMVEWRELWQYRDLFASLVWRDVKIRYAQSILGIGWAVVQPVFNMVVFTIIFGNLAKMDSEGVPYAIFSFAALVPWTYFSGALTSASGSLIAASAMITKVYFPRLVVPVAPVLGKLVDFAVATLLLFGMMLWFHIPPTFWVLTLPFLVLLMVLTATGLGIWLAALSVHYRDVNYAMQFAIQALMYAAPVVYPASKIPGPYRLLYGLNPMAGVIEGFRSAFLGTAPMPWDLLIMGTITALMITISGIIYFRHMERIFADVI